MPFKNMPDKANRQWKHVYNSALESGNDEESAAKKAWGVVKKYYKKVNGKWVRRKTKKTVESAVVLECIYDVLNLVNKGEN